MFYPKEQVNWENEWQGFQMDRRSIIKLEVVIFSSHGALSFFQVFHKMWKILKIQVKLILKNARALAITCLLHKGHYYIS